MSKHEQLNSQRVGFFRSPFDKLRANGKILNSTALGIPVHPTRLFFPSLRIEKQQQGGRVGLLLLLFLNLLFF